jgi:serine/threonine protein kinase
MQAADTLDDVHSRGIMHRDFKLASIMVKPRGQVKVSDFGLAKLSPLRASARDHSENRPAFSQVRRERDRVTARIPMAYAQTGSGPGHPDNGARSESLPTVDTGHRNAGRPLR